MSPSERDIEKGDLEEAEETEGTLPRAEETLLRRVRNGHGLSQRIRMWYLSSRLMTWKYAWDGWRCRRSGHKFEYIGENMKLCTRCYLSSGEWTQEELWEFEQVANDLQDRVNRAEPNP